MENPEFLKKKYDLHNTPEVESANTRLEKRTGEKTPQDPKERIQNYLDRFTEIIERKEPGKRERGIEAIKEVIDEKYIIKSEDIPESYYENQKKLAREQGHGDIELTDEARKQLQEVIIKDQKDSLNNWIDYLSSKDATYPDWLKYFAIRNILSMGEYDKEKKQFTKRSKGTVKPFPDINREALAYVLDAIEKKNKGIPSDKDPEFQTLLQGENFAKLYAWAIDKATPESEEGLANIKGEWVKYRQGKDHMPLVESLQGHGTGWCTAGESTAKAQMEGGDFYVYYSQDKNGKSNVPRAAIRMQQGQIAEVRGIAKEQNLDPYIGDVVKKKLTEFSDGPKYEKKVADMKLLTQIENKTTKGEQLIKEELIFLYEINNKIESFGYQRDPRIKEIIDKRNPKEDAPIVLDCKPEQIATNEKEISKDSKAYIGDFNLKILKLFPAKIEHVYTKFPENKVFLKEITPDKEITSAKTAIAKLEVEGHQVNEYAKEMLTKVDWKEKLKSSYKVVSVSVGELFDDKRVHTYAEIKAKAKENGLDLVPASLAPSIRENYEKSGEYTAIAMEAIRDRGGSLELFHCSGDDSASWLDSNDGHDDDKWGDHNRFFFVRK